MPYYDLKCRRCELEFNAKATISMRVNNEIPCPDCGGNEHDSIFKTLNYSVSKRSDDACPNSHVCGCNCRHH